MRICFSLVALLFWPMASQAALRVITSTTDLAALVQAVGGSHVEVSSLLKGTENPHYVDAVPDFIRQVAEAQVVCQVGLDLEVGWMPRVLARSGNAKVQPGGQGFCEVGKNIEVLEKPVGPVDRSGGDIHPSGNPHFWTSPRRLAQAVPEVVTVLSRVDAAHATEYAKNGADVVNALNDLQKKDKAELSAFSSGPVAIEYHKEFTYFLQDNGLKSMGSVEEKPGVPPSMGRIGEVATAAKNSGVRFLLAASYSPAKTLDRFHDVSGLPVVKYPTSILLKDRKSRGLQDYIDFHHGLLTEILRVLKSSKQNVGANSSFHP